MQRFTIPNNIILQESIQTNVATKTYREEKERKQQAEIEEREKKEEEREKKKGEERERKRPFRVWRKLISGYQDQRSCCCRSYSLFENYPCPPPVTKQTRTYSLSLQI